jgi:hypothetical protein
MGGEGTYSLDIVGSDSVDFVYTSTTLILECEPCCETLSVTLGPLLPSVPECYTAIPESVSAEITFSGCDIQWRIYQQNCDLSETLYDFGAGAAPVVSFSYSLAEGELWNGGALCPDTMNNFRLAYWCGDLDPNTDPESGSIDIIDTICA